jgi:hypothetical protein
LLTEYVSCRNSRLDLGKGTPAYIKVSSHLIKELKTFAAALD